MDQHLNMILKAIEFIEAHLQEPISVQDVCTLSSLSPWQFQRVFRAVVGDSIGNYIRGRRLAQAANVLQTTKPFPRILDIAIEFQFGSQEAFSRAFKRAYGINPGEIRSLPLSRLPTAKPRLDWNKLIQLNNGIKKEPRFQMFGSKSFIGISNIIKSPLGIDTAFDGEVARQWEFFDQKRTTIENRIRGFSYGFAFSSGLEMEEENLCYLAAVEVPETLDVPAEMEAFSMKEEQLFAVFEVTGFLESCHVTTDYIYGIWLPQAKFIRGCGPDIELFEHKFYKRGDPKSVSSYFLPVIPK